MGSDSEDCLYVAHVLLPAAFWSRDKELNSPDGVPQVSPAHKHDIF
jgi:hypothetical protein